MKKGSLIFALYSLIVLSISILSPGNTLFPILLANVKWFYATGCDTSARNRRNKTLFGSSNCVRIPINSGLFLLCIISSRQFIIDSNLLMIRHLDNEAFGNFNFSKPSASVHY